MRSKRKTSPSAERLRRGPDRGAALAQYEVRAATYDLELALFEPFRKLAIDRLELQSGETVLDVGCGTGLSLERLRRAVGATGHVIGIEQCPAMIDRARNRIAGQEGGNVTLLCAPAEEAHIDGCADAALLHFTHDVLRRPAALDRVLRHLRSGARLVACGLKWAPPWAVPVNVFVGERHCDRSRACGVWTGRGASWPSVSPISKSRRCCWVRYFSRAALARDKVDSGL